MSNANGYVNELRAKAGVDQVVFAYRKHWRRRRCARAINGFGGGVTVSINIATVNVGSEAENTQFFQEMSNYILDAARRAVAPRHQALRHRASKSSSSGVADRTGDLAPAIRVGTVRGKWPRQWQWAREAAPGRRGGGSPVRDPAGLIAKIGAVVETIDDIADG